MTQRLRDLPGLGLKSEAMLQRVGIETVAQLRELGAVQAYMKVQRSSHKPPGMNLLYALVGAIEGVHWQTVAREQKSALLTQLEGIREMEAVFKNAP